MLVSVKEMLLQKVLPLLKALHLLKMLLKEIVKG